MNNFIFLQFLADVYVATRHSLIHLLNSTMWPPMKYWSSHSTHTLIFMLALWWWSNTFGCVDNMKSNKRNNREQSGVHTSSSWWLVLDCVCCGDLCVWSVCVRVCSCQVWPVVTLSALLSTPHLSLWKIISLSHPQRGQNIRTLSCSASY